MFDPASREAADKAVDDRRRAEMKDQDTFLAAQAGTEAAGSALAFAPEIGTIASRLGHAVESIPTPPVADAMREVGVGLDAAGNVVMAAAAGAAHEAPVLLARAGPEALSFLNHAKDMAATAPDVARGFAATLRDAVHRAPPATASAASSAGSGVSHALNLRLPLTDAQKAAGIAYDAAGNVVNSAGVVLARAGSEALGLVTQGVEELSRGAEYAAAGASAAAEGATDLAQTLAAQAGPHVRLATTLAMRQAGIVYNEAGQLVSASGEVLAQAGADAQAMCRAGIAVGCTGATEAYNAATAAVSAGTPYVREALTSAQEAAGMAYNAAGQVVSSTGAVLAQAGPDAARLVEEGRRQMAAGADAAADAARGLVAAGSPYAQAALSGAQAAMGLAYNEAGLLVNRAGQLVDTAGHEISLAAAQGLQAASAGAAEVLPLVRSAGEAVAGDARALADGAASLARSIDLSAVSGAAHDAGAAIAGAAGAAAAAAAPAAREIAGAAGAAGAAVAAEAKEAAHAAATTAAQAGHLVAPVVDAAATEAAAAMATVMDEGAAAAHGIAADFYSSDIGRAAETAGAAAFSEVSEVYTMSRDALEGGVEAAQEGCSSLLHGAESLVKLEIFRDFFQTISLFFVAIKSKAIVGARAFFGKLAGFLALDWSFTFTVPPVAIYVLIAVLAVAVIIAFIWMVWRANKMNPDEIRDGHEAVTWKERAERNKKSTTAIKWILTACTSLYLPVSKICVQLLVCDGQVGMLLHKLDSSLTCTDDADFPGVKDCDCGGWKYMLYFRIGAVVLLLGFTMFLPVMCYRLIKSNIPVGSREDPNIRYDEDGNPQEYTDAMFLRDIQHDPRQQACPYVFLYKGYERKWCYYKVVVMVFKFLLVVPVILLWRTPVTQSLAMMALLFTFMGLSFYSSPFVSESSDRMDASGRVTAFAIVALGLVGLEESGLSDTMSLFINLINGVNLFLMIFFFLTGLQSVRTWFKNKTGRVSFQDTVTEKVGSAADIIPAWDLARETKHRIWHPFWGSILLQKCGEEVYERLKEEIALASDNGRHRIKDHFNALRDPNIGLWRRWVQENLEGLDVFWDGVPADGHLDSVTRFGKMYVIPYPFHCVMVYDDDTDYAFVREDLFGEFVNKNLDPYVAAKRSHRQMARCLHGRAVALEHSQWETHSVPDGMETYTDSEGNTQTRQRTSAVQVEMFYHQGTFNVANNKKHDCMNPKYEWSAGFKPTIHYSDGHGIAVAPNTGQTHHITGSTTIGREAMGMDEEMGVTRDAYGRPCPNGRFYELIAHPMNAEHIRQAMPALLQHHREYRQSLLAERAKSEAVLSSGFWLFCYDAWAKPREKLEFYFRQFETNPVVKELPGSGKDGLDYLYFRVGFVLSHPCAALWFVFVDDTWAQNKAMTHFKGKEELWDSRKTTSIAYKPMKRSSFEAWLKTNMPGCGYFKEDLLDALYARMDELNGGSGAAGATERMDAPLLA